MGFTVKEPPPDWFGKGFIESPRDFKEIIKEIKLAETSALEFMINESILKAGRVRQVRWDGTILESHFLK